MSKKVLDVSIVAANYNNGPFIKEFVESIINSVAIPAELLIIDDGSSDNSAEILEKFTRIEWIKIVKLPKNIGFGNALNKGIDLASSTYLLRIDPDDRILPQRIDKQYKFLIQNPEIDIVGSNAEYFNSQNGRIISETNFPLSPKKIEHRILQGEHGVLHGTVMGKTKLFKDHLYRQASVPAEDYDIFARMLKDGAKFYNLNEVLTEVRIHLSSVSNNIKMSTITKTYAIRDEVFGTKTSKLNKLRYYYHIFYYRKYLYSLNPVYRGICLILSVILYPQKVIQRFFK